MPGHGTQTFEFDDGMEEAAFHAMIARVMAEIGHDSGCSSTALSDLELCDCHLGLRATRAAKRALEAVKAEIDRRERLS